MGQASASVSQTKERQAALIRADTRFSKGLSRESPTGGDSDQLPAFWGPQPRAETLTLSSFQQSKTSRESNEQAGGRGEANRLIKSSEWESVIKGWEDKS